MTSLGKGIQVAPGAVGYLPETGREAEYARLWYLYPWDAKSSIHPNVEAWVDFLESVDALDNPPSS